MKQGCRRAQARLLAQLLGGKCFVWNRALARRREAYAAGDKISLTQLSRELTELRRQLGLEWLGALPREPLTEVLRELERAYSNFFVGRAKFPTLAGQPKARGQGAPAPALSAQPSAQAACGDGRRRPPFRFFSLVFRSPLQAI